MGKTIARNLTNRTVECHLPGGRWMRLRPGETRALDMNDNDCGAVRKLRRDRVLDVIDTEQEKKSVAHVTERRDLLAHRIGAESVRPEKEKGAGGNAGDKPPRAHSRFSDFPTFRLSDAKR